MAADEPKEAESGKPTTPWERMQVANSTSAPPDDWPPPWPAGTSVVVVPAEATPAFGLPPPQAVTTRMKPTTAAATSNKHRYFVVDTPGKRFACSSMS